LLKNKYKINKKKSSRTYSLQACFQQPGGLNYAGT